MKQTKDIIVGLSFFLIATLIFGTGCYDFANSPGVSIWSGGVGVFAWLFVAGVIACLVKSVLQAKEQTKKLKYSDFGKYKRGTVIKFYQTTWFFGACAFAAVATWWIWDHISNR